MLAAWTVDCAGAGGVHYSFDIPELETPRLRLRGFTQDDVHPMIDFCDDDLTMEFMGGPRTPSDTAQRHASMIGHWVLKGYGMWAVEEKSGGRFAGRVGLIDFEGWPQIELGWLIGRPFWGRGYAPEAARAAAGWAFDVLGLDSLVSLIHPDNANSIRVAEKLGSVPSETIPWAGDVACVHRLSRQAISSEA